MAKWLITLICVGSVVTMFFIIWGITEFVYYLIEKHYIKKWAEAKNQYPEIQKMIDARDRLWEVYDKKSDIANGYKKQIDNLLGNLVYLPSYEVEWRQEKAEEYKKMYFEARNEADKWNEAYRQAFKNLTDFCEEHKIRQME